MIGDSVKRLFNKSKKLSKAIRQDGRAPGRPKHTIENTDGPAQFNVEHVEKSIVAIPGVRVDLRYTSWSSGGYIVSGWLTSGGKKRQVPREFELFAKPLGKGPRNGQMNWLKLSSVTNDAEHLDINAFVRSKDDLSKATFTALVPHNAWESLLADDLQIVFKIGDQNQATPITHRYRWGSAGHLSAEIRGSYRYAPHWDNDLGLCISRSQPTAFISGTPEIANELRLKAQLLQDFVPTTAHFRHDASGSEVPIRLQSTSSGVILSASLDSLPPTPGAWGITLRNESGSRRLLHWSVDRWDHLSVAPGVYLEQRSGGIIRLIRGELPLVAEEVAFSERQITVRLREDNLNEVDTLIMRGPRATLQAYVQSPGQYIFDLDYDFWGTPAPVPPAGGYRVFARKLDGSLHPVRLSRSLSSNTPLVETTPLATFRTEHTPDNQLYVDISAPLLAEEKGLFNRRRLATLHTGERQSASDTVSRGVFLESWYGKTFSDNPAPMVKSLRDAGVPGPYYVAVADFSVAFPPETHPVIVGSKDYWKALGSSRVVIFNTWLPSEYKKRTDQFIVQTWHGTPLKSLGMDVPHRIGSKTSAKNLGRGSAMWDLLVSQSSYATEIFRRAYLYEGEVAEVGYPRNDALADVDPQGLRRLVRSKLALSDDAQVILYAPTWRPEDKGSVGPLDVVALLDLLPRRFHIAVRGHSVTLRRGSNLAGERIVDVTSYPEPAELMAMSDLLVTDYSSIMFDYAASGRPILYYTPDYEEYVALGRGAYFNLKQSAPGPLTSTPEELAQAILTAPQTVTSERYRAWQKKFVPHDDGHSAERLCRLIADRLSAGSS